MGITTEKLSEAKFFLEQIEANYLEHPAFDYFLGAFISSARSVLWIMRSEYNDIEGWESWYKSLEPSTSDEALLQKINVARIRTEKHRQELESMVSKTIEFSMRPVSVQDNLADLSPTNNGVNFIGEIESIYRVLGELGDDDVLVVCREYFATIKNVVFECENRFG